MKACIKLLFLLVGPAAVCAAESKEFCLYKDKTGVLKQVNSRASVPIGVDAKCFNNKSSDFLAKPEDVKLEGNVRHEDMVSSIGRIQLRWPRKVELLFGRTPQRAMADAASTASRALKSAGFPSAVQNLNLDWKVVFMDEELPETQIPTTLISNCHPAWMTPPSNIYVVSQRVAAGCGGQKSASKVADSELAHILLHEIGHAVEHQILKSPQYRDRMRAEGFASWFEAYAADYSAIIEKKSVEKNYFRLAKEAMREQPAFVFAGSPHDYARASLYFHAVVARRGVRGLMEVYQAMDEKALGFTEALSAKLHWDSKRLQQEVMKVLE